jgi:hypothetical protein
MVDSDPIILKGHIVREDEYGFVCLDDIWELAAGKASQLPKFWRQGEALKRIERTLLGKVRNSHHLPKTGMKSVIYAKRGRHGAIFAHPIIAAMYAGYLSPDLEIQMREVYLRYRAGDATLADDILDRAPDEANRWVAARAITRVERRKFTDTLQRAGVSGTGYARCTNAIYRGLWHTDTKGLRTALGVPSKKSPRDSMDAFQLSQVSLAEGMATGRIEEEECVGTSECEEASLISAGFVRQAVEAEKASRVKRPRLF